MSIIPTAKVRLDKTMPPKKNLIFAPAAFNLADTTRMIEIAKGITAHDVASKVSEIQFILDGGDSVILITAHCDVYEACLVEKQGGKMATEFCEKCKQAHPGRSCDYDDRGECAETVNVEETPESSSETPKHLKKHPDR